MELDQEKQNQGGRRALPCTGTAHRAGAGPRSVQVLEDSGLLEKSFL